MRYGLPYGMGFGEQTEKKSMDFAFWSKGAGGETPLKSGYVLAYHERMQQCIKQGGTAGMRMNVLSRHKVGMGFFYAHGHPKEEEIFHTRLHRN